VRRDRDRQGTGLHVPRRPRADLCRHRRDGRCRIAGRCADALQPSAASPTTSPTTTATRWRSRARSCATCGEPAQAALDAQPSLPPRFDPREIYGLISRDPKIPTDTREILARFVDDSRFQEFKPLYGDTLLTGFARIHGHEMGILANQGVLFS
jgi:hypothetical protein